MTILLQDDFSEADGTNLNGKSLDVGGTWEVAGGTYDIQSGRAGKVGGGGEIYAAADSGASDCVLTCDLVTPATGGINAGPAVRYLDQNNLWAISLSNSAGSGGTYGARLYERNSGSYTLRATGGSFLANNTSYAVEVTLSATTITVAIDGVTVITYSSATFNETKTKHGLYANGNSSYDKFSRFDNFFVSSGTTYSGDLLSAPIIGGYLIK